DDDTTPEAFSVYTPVRFPGAELRRADSVSATLAEYYAGAEWRGAVEGAKGDLLRLLQTTRERQSRKEEALREELRGLDEAQALRAEADLLLAIQTEVPKGAGTYTLADPFAETPETARQITLTLDPRLDAVGNANKRYQRYHKLQRAAEMIPAQLDANAVEIARTEQFQTDLALAETLPEIEHVRAEVAEAGYLRRAGRKQPAPGKSGKKPNAKGGKGSKGGKGGKGGQPAQRVVRGGPPLKRQSAEGFAILVGKNSNQNETVTFHEATNNDLWLHARGVPGAHVVVRSAGRTIPETTIQYAAALAAYYSQARTAGTVPVDYTQQRHVRHMKGGGPGMVIYERERTLFVTPEDAGSA
ncbi:MAG: NFACT RNA binding domain-containing protein, partial [Ktedonobacterales bacterium]